jgi:hypothetical protein
VVSVKSAADVRRRLQFSASHGELFADPSLRSIIEKAARFYEADLPMGTLFRFHVVVQPRATRRLVVACQLEGDHPLLSSALFLGNKRPFAEVVESLAPAGRHLRAISSPAKRSRGFVYALPRTQKSYAFVCSLGTVHDG